MKQLDLLDREADVLELARELIADNPAISYRKLPVPVPTFRGLPVVEALLCREQKTYPDPTPLEDRPRGQRPKYFEPCPLPVPSGFPPTRYKPVRWDITLTLQDPEGLVMKKWRDL